MKVFCVNRVSFMIGLRFRKKIGQFIFRNGGNLLQTLFGPSEVSFASLTSNEEIGKVQLWIQYIERFALFYPFPNLRGLSSHVCGVSIFVRKCEVFVSMYCS